MRVLFHHLAPFSLTHGGVQVQILQTRAALEALGVEIDFLRWWDGEQQADLIHFFGRAPVHLVRTAQQKGIKVVVADLLTEQGSRPRFRLWLQEISRRVLRKAAPQFTSALNWDSYRLADACVALTHWESNLMTELFGALPAKTHVVPNGVEEVFLNSQATERGRWLVCTATITERKRIMELAQAAVMAATPLWVIGRPYSEADPYVSRFVELARQNASVLRYEGAISDRAKLAQVYRQARGFVLLSAMESLSLSALEAAAGECPLLLSDLPWARTVFEQNAWYCSARQSTAATATVLRKFYDAAPALKPPPKPMTWRDVGAQLKALYEELLGKNVGD